MQDKGVKLYALVNNAGIGGGAETEVIIDTNFKGPKRVTDALVGLIDKSGGRIVNVSSGLRKSTKRWIQVVGKFMNRIFCFWTILGNKGKFLQFCCSILLLRAVFFMSLILALNRLNYYTFWVKID